MKIVIDGDPKPQGRIRFARNHAHYSKADVEYREQISWQARQQWHKAPLEGEICAGVKLYRKYKRTAPQFGDVDNHLKSLFDGLSGIVFNDDRQVVRCVVEKFTDKENPRAEIEITEAGT